MMSKILPLVIRSIQKQGINKIAAVADQRNLAAMRLLRKTGFIYQSAFDHTKDLFKIADFHLETRLQMA